jgi:hypothetical protein
MTTLMASRFVPYPSFLGKLHRAQYTVTRDCTRHRLSLARAAVLTKYLKGEISRMETGSDHIEDRTNLDLVRWEVLA